MTTMSKRNKRTPSTAAARSSRAGASYPSVHEKFAGFMRVFLRVNFRMMLFLIGAASILQPFVPWTNDNSNAMWFILIGSIALGLAVPPRLWR